MLFLEINLYFYLVEFGAFITFFFLILLLLLSSFFTYLRISINILMIT